MTKTTIRIALAGAALFSAFLSYNAYDSFQNRRAAAEYQRSLLRENSALLRRFISENEANYVWLKAIGDAFDSRAETVGVEKFYSSIQGNQTVIVPGYIEDYVAIGDNKYLLSIVFAPIEGNEIFNFKIKATCNSKQLIKIKDMSSEIFSAGEPEGLIAYFVISISSFEQHENKSNGFSEKITVAQGEFIDSLLWNGPYSIYSIDQMIKGEI
jgi:hypothetical protein